MLPSDPDFPFEMDSLQCVLRVPLDYPRTQSPSLRITNQEMDRGYQINVEKGFHSLMIQSPTSTLLALMNALDKQLENFLVGPKADTFKLITNASNRESDAKALPSVNEKAAPSPDRPVYTEPAAVFTAQQRAEARSKRAVEIRSLEARLGRHPMFSKLPGGLSFLVPRDLPTDIRDINSAELIVPISYGLEPCRITLDRPESSIAASIEAAFQQRARDHPEMTLMAHVNYLAQNMHSMRGESEVQVMPSGSRNLSTAGDSHRSDSEMQDKSVPDDPPGSHLKSIPRPPEWSDPRNEEEDDSSSEDYEPSELSDEADGGAPIPPEDGERPAPERGILLTFPQLELHGIEVLEMTSLSLTIKCERCKDYMDVKNVESKTARNSSSIRTSSCKKCARPLSVGMSYLRSGSFSGID